MPQTETTPVVIKESYQSTMKAAGFPRKDWDKIYKAPYNKKLRKLRPSPEQIVSGDEIHLPKYSPKYIKDFIKRSVLLEKCYTDLESEIEKLRNKLKKAEKSRDAQETGGLVAYVATVNKAISHTVNVNLASCTDALSCGLTMKALATMESHRKDLLETAKSLKELSAKNKKAADANIKKIKEKLASTEKLAKRFAAEMKRMTSEHKKILQSPW
ncbi:MAG: hypothetical protein AAGJ46_06600 [Planctomycetota bacterium]